ncbi:MMPL family transporter [Candidatus Poribacteria bacterium]|nr:MMPL family transporter [Candidatus Poribacteria bacterium]
MKLSDLSIKRAVTFSMIFIAVAIFGIVSLVRLSPELLPDITFPAASIIVTYEGIGPEDMEQLVARPLEETLSTITGVTEVTSTCREGAVVVMVSFDWGSDMDAATSDIRERLDLVADFIPDDASDPLVFKFDVSMQPILYLGVASDTLTQAEVRKLCLDEIEPILERVEGVAIASTMGGESREIQVQLDRDKMEAYELSIQQVINVIRGENVSMPAGDIQEDKFKNLLRTIGEFTDPDQINDIVVTYKDGAPIYIRDVAEVYDTTAEKKQAVRINSKPGVSVYLQKQADANTVDAVKRTKEALNELEQKLGDKVDISILMDQSKFINRSLGNLANVAIIGSILAVVVLFLFLHNVRSVIIIALAIPMSVIATFMAMDATGVSLNMLSMGGLALGVGMLVDNAIVVLENVFRHREEGEDRKTAASIGTSEVATAIIASTLTTISVFFPIVFVPGIAGVLFKDQALTVTFSLACSLLVALTLVPLLCSRFLRVRSEKKSKGITNGLSGKMDTYISRLDDYYQRILNWALDHRGPVIITMAILLVASIMIIWPLQLVGTEFIPNVDQGEIMLSMETPPGTSLEVTEEAVARVEKMIMDVTGEDFENMYITVGSGEGMSALFSSGGSHSASANITLVHRSERERSQKEIERAIKDRLSEIAGIRVLSTEDPGAAMLGFGGMPVNIEIYGYDQNIARNLAEEIKEMVEGIEGTVDVQTSIEKASPETQIIINRDRAYTMGLNVATIANTIQSNVYGTVATLYREGGDEYNILVRLKESDRKTRDDVYNTSIMSPLGTKVSLKNVATLKPAEGPVNITRKKQERMVTVTGDLQGRDMGSVLREVREGLDKIDVPQGFIVSIGGTGEDMMESFQWLGLALIGAVFLVYAVMASLFESLLDPFIIMLTFPLAIIGVIWMFFLTGTVFSIIAFVGVIMLTGIVVNNAIVMVDYINQLRENGMELREAVVTGGRTRLRPILITALTTILAMTPLALGVGSGSEIRYPMARAVVGGLSVSTVLTLVIVPIFYTIFEGISERRKARKEAKKAEASETTAD